MRKLLGLMGAFALTASVSSPMVACSSPSEPTYETVEDAIKVLNLTSYAKTATTTVKDIASGIIQDAINILATNNYSSVVAFDRTDADKLILDPIKVINNSTKEALKTDDLVSDTVLPLKVTFTYDGKDVEAASSTLNVTTKTVQEIVNFINGYNFNKFWSKSPLPLGITVNVFQKNMKNLLLSSFFYGSFWTFINTKSFIINTDDVKKGDVALSQDDLNKLGTIGITVNYKYGEIDQERISFNVNIKIDISKAKVTYEELPITLPDISKNNLTEAAVDKIKTAITKAIQAALTKVKVPDLSTIATTDYTVSGIESTVKKGADFTNQITVTFTIIAKSDSAKFGDKLVDQKIKITVSDQV